MKVLLKKVSVFLLAVATAAAAVSANLSVKAEEPAAISEVNVVGLGVEYHTQAEISEFAKNHPAPFTQDITYKVPPSLNEPYTPGILSDETVDSALNMLNQVRYIAGVSADVKHNEEQAAQASAATLLNYLNGVMSHYPAWPAQFGQKDNEDYKELFDNGCSGAQNSNIDWRSTSMQFSLNEIIITGWCADYNSAENIRSVGHRRWFLSPALQTVGFGATYQYTKGKGFEEHTAAYIYHNGFSGTYSGKYIAWPAQEMPLKNGNDIYFGDGYPWSLSLGDVPNESEVSVSVTRKADGKVWNFSSTTSDGEFYVDTDRYGGSSAAIIFLPKDINIKVGDTYEVEVKINASTTVQYNVNFFDLEKPNDAGNTGNDSGTDSGNTENGSGTDTGNTENGNGTDTGNTENGSGTDTGNTENGSGTDTGNTGNGSGTDTGNTGNGSGANTNNTSNRGASSNVNTVFTERIINVDWKTVETTVDEALQAAEENIYVLAGTSYTVPSSVVGRLAGKDTALMIQSGSGLAISISGKDVKKRTSELEIDLSFSDVIPDAVSRQVADGAILKRAFSMTKKDKFPFKVDVHLSLGAENAGKTATLYYYDETRRILRPMGDFIITATGQAMFALTRGDEYIVLVTEQSPINLAKGSYTVVRGDTLFKIANKNGVSVNDILRINPQIKNPNRIYTNQVIALP